MMFQRILVPLDGSPRAERAIPLAARLARHAGGSILLLRVVTHPLDAVASLLRPPQETEEAIEAQHTLAVSYLEHVACAGELSGVASTLQLADSNPAQTILSAARLQQVDSIVMCSHAGPALKRWALGSVAQRVARQSPVPVLLLPEGEEGAISDLLHPTEARRVHVLVPLDGTALAEAALLSAAWLSAALSAPADGSLHLVVVLPEGDTEQQCPGQRIEAVQQKAYLRTIEQRMQTGDLASLHVGTSSSVIIGTDVAQTLIRLAEEEFTGQKDAQISRYVAMATHGREGTALWVMGSVTQRVLQSLHLPLLVVRPRQLTQSGEE